MTTSRQYKDRLFSFIFGREEHKEWTLSLYNAIRGSHYTNPEDIQITTIRDVLYLGMHNDVSFIIANELNLYEQQSTYNPNMRYNSGEGFRSYCRKGSEYYAILRQMLLRAGGGALAGLNG